MLQTASESLFATVLKARGKSSKSALIGGLVGGIVGGCLLIIIAVGLWKTRRSAYWRPWGSRMPSRVNTREMSDPERGPMDRGY